MLRLFPILMAVIMGYLLNAAFFSEHSGKKYLMSLQNRLIEQQNDNKALKERNTLLEFDIHSLQKDFNALEELARQQMGLIQRDETFYHIITPNTQ